MQSEAAHRRIRTALRAELKRRHGQIGQIEADLDRSEGYLSRFCRGDMELTLKGCLEVLEALEIEPGSFFSTTFGTVTRSEDILRTLEGEGPFDRYVASFSEAEARIEAGPDIVQGLERRHRVRACDLDGLSVEAQLRRLRTGKKYRCESLVEEMLVRLERSRYDEPRAAVRIVVGLATYVVPQLPVSSTERIKWLCRCAGVYASSLRATDVSRSAAQVLRLALGWSRKYGLEIESAALLRRGAFVASDFADYDGGLLLLREAQEIVGELDLQRDLGYVFISRAFLLGYKGSSSRAVRSYRRAISLLEAFEDTEARRWLLTAYSGLVNVFTNRGELEIACRWMARATSIFEDEGGLILGKLLWQQGSIERGLGRLSAAKLSLQASRQLLEVGSGIDYALVSIELASVLLKLGEHRTALEVAKSLVTLTDALDSNPLVESAVLESMRVILSGGLDIAVLEALRASLENGRPSIRGARSDSRG